MSYKSAQGVLSSTSPTVVYVCPIGKQAIVQSIRVTNPAAFDITVTRINLDLYTVALSAGEILTDYNFIALDPGEYIELLTSTPGTTYILYISEY